MNKIKSEVKDNYFVANSGYSYVKEATSEVSTFGSFCYEGGKMIFNEFGGSLIRLKKKCDNEGGIAIDKAVIAGICLVQPE